MGAERAWRAVARVTGAVAGLTGRRSTTTVHRDDDTVRGNAESRPHAGPAAGRTRPVTDGGADEASPGDAPWMGDDPIAFDDAGSDHGSALLDAVTEDEEADASPLADEAASVSDGPQSGSAAQAGSGATRSSAGDGIDPDRLDELEARIDALETDHVQLESGMADVAASVEDVRGEVADVGVDVRQLVALLGGIAVASTGANASRKRDAVASEPEADDVRGASATSGPPVEDSTDDLASSPTVQSAGASTGEPAAASTGEPAAASTDEPASASTNEQDGRPAAGTDDTAATESDEASRRELDEASTEERDDASLGDGNDPLAEERDGEPTGRRDDASDGIRVDESPVPDGIHRGVGDPPEARSGPGSTGNDAPSTVADRSDEPSRELVDPRTDAVGARLRQFREGFVDDPTADLPTGDAADEFRFEKILLPTDGEAAPDLSAGELEKPYLESLPDGYAADAVVLEWLDWLVSAADGATAARAVAYYESIEWLTAEVRDDLLGYLDGLEETGSARAAGEESAGDGSAGAEDGPADDASVGEPPAALDLQDHLRSLQYVTELASGEVGTDGV